MSVNRNKRSIEVDFTSAKGKAVILKLAESCDVVVENFIPGKLASMGLGYDHVSAVNPRIIYVSISGYGDTGPRAQQPGYDVAISAIGGLLSITGPEDGPPAKVGVALIDVLTGMYAVSAINAALFHREVLYACLFGEQGLICLRSRSVMLRCLPQKTGKGQYISCSLLESQV
jgi:succinate---hydroxymethylglutarate CoA-transferase